MLRERYSKDEFEKIFQSFNTAVYNGEMEKLNYKSWRNIKNWLSDEKYPQMEVSKEWVRIRDNASDTNPYAYHDKERIFVGPYDHVRCCPNPEELDPEDKSFGTWLNRVLNKEKLISTNLNNTFTDVALSASNVKETLEQLNSAFVANKPTISASDPYADYAIGTINTNMPSHYYEFNPDGLYIGGKQFDDYIKETITNIYDKEKENNKMMKFDFGPVDSSVHMSMYGMAIKNASGTYVAYDANSKQIMDVDILNFEGANKFIYKMPATLAQIAAGDVIIHARKPMFVQEVREDNRLSVMDIFDGEEKVIVPSVSPFGFNFMTKVVSLFDFSNATADESNPFGNMLPFLLMSDSKSSDKDNLLPLMFMMNGNTNIAQNPMMLWALAGNRTNDPMMLAMLMGGFAANPNGSNGK